MSGPSSAKTIAALPYVFIIGFNKCATQSLSSFFEANGFPAVHWDHGNLALAMMTNAAAQRPLLHPYDADFRVFSDMHFLNDSISVEANAFFPTLDRDYPGSFFVYNTRPMAAWIKSRLAHCNLAGESLADRYARATGLAIADVPAAWEAERRVFEQRLFRYFAKSPRLLVLDVEAPEPAARLAVFLGREMNLEAWPWTGRTQLSGE
jgi:hypothetical protein